MSSPAMAPSLLVVAEQLVDRALGEGWSVTGQSFLGKELERWTYQRPFDLVPVDDAHYVVLATYVTTEDGSGLVHQAPAFGADDLAVSRAYGLPMVNPVRQDGTFEPDLPSSAGASSRTRTRCSSMTLRPAGCSFGSSPTSTAIRTAGVATRR